MPCHPSPAPTDTAFSRYLARNGCIISESPCLHLVALFTPGCLIYTWLPCLYLSTLSIRAMKKDSRLMTGKHLPFFILPCHPNHPRYFAPAIAVRRSHTEHKGFISRAMQSYLLQFNSHARTLSPILNCQQPQQNNCKPNHMRLRKLVKEDRYRIDSLPLKTSSP